MNILNMILDEYAKKGILDGNAVERISAAHEREIKFLNESNDDVVERIKSVLNRLFPYNEETDEPSAEFDDTYTDYDAVSDIAKIIYE